MNTIGQKIYDLRTENKMTQAQLAEILNLTPKMISFYERGERMPSREVVMAIANFFNLSVDYLLERTNDPRTSIALAIEKYGFYYPYNEREKLKDEFKQANSKHLSLNEKVKLCEKDLKMFFSRSIDASAFDLSHICFEEYASMLLNQVQFKKRYGEAYEKLCEKYHPKEGILEGRTHYRIYENTNNIEEIMERLNLTNEVKEIIKLTSQDQELAKKVLESLSNYEK